MKLTSLVKPALVVAASLMVAPVAMADGDDEKVSPQVAEEITMKLEAQGYDVRDIEKDDDMFEAKVVKGGERFELELNQAFEIVKSEIAGQEENESENVKEEDKG